MTGDKHKPLKTFMRWINSFDDGVESTTKKGHKRVPSLSDKRKERRWRRHYEKDKIIRRKEWQIKNIRLV